MTDVEALGSEEAERIANGELGGLPFSFVLSDLDQDDHPIVYVNRTFERLSGYSRDQVIGRNCRLLQGEKTDPEAVASLRHAVAKREPVVVELINYRADGTPFLNRLYLTPLENEAGAVRYVLGIQTRIAKSGDVNGKFVNDALLEIQHRVKNHLSMIVGLIRLQARGDAAAPNFGMLARRVESLQLLYEEMTASSTGSAKDIALGAYLSRISNAIGHIDGRPGVRVNVDVDEVAVPVETAVRIGLVVSEILTNAMQHAFEGRDQGLVELIVDAKEDGGLVIRVRDDGVGIEKCAKWPNDESLGGRLVTQFTANLRATLSVVSGDEGTTVTLDAPAATARAGA